MSTKKSPPAKKLAVPVTLIERRIYLIRGQKVTIDSDLAELYGVETKILNRGVRRNLERFPEDFIFQLTKDEAESLRIQFGTLEFVRRQLVYSAPKREDCVMNHSDGSVWNADSGSPGQ